jgi:hypothetical protein
MEMKIEVVQWCFGTWAEGGVNGGGSSISMAWLNLLPGLKLSCDYPASSNRSSEDINAFDQDRQLPRFRRNM